MIPAIHKTYFLGEDSQVDKMLSLAESTVSGSHGSLPGLQSKRHREVYWVEQCVGTSGGEG